MLCDITKQCTADILIPRETAITLQLLVGDAPSLWNLCSKWPTPFEKRWLRPISAYNVFTVRESEKSSTMMRRKTTTSFPTSYRWSVYVIHKTRKGGSKAIFSFLLSKNKLQSIKVCYKVSLCENFQQQSCTTAIPLSNGP